MPDSTPPSAAEHEWREVVVHIYPSQSGARFAVFLRKNKGSHKVWQRHLCTIETPALDAAEVVRFEGLLRIAGACLLDAAARAKRH